MRPSRTCAVVDCGQKDSDTKKWILVCANAHWMHQECLEKWFESKVVPTCPLCNDDTMGRIRDIVISTEQKVRGKTIAARIGDEEEEEEEEGEEEGEEDDEDSGVSWSIWMCSERDALRDLTNAYAHQSLVTRVEGERPSSTSFCCESVEILHLTRQLSAAQQVISSYANYFRKQWKQNPGLSGQQCQYEHDTDADADAEDDEISGCVLKPESIIAPEESDPPYIPSRTPTPDDYEKVNANDLPPPPPPPSTSSSSSPPPLPASPSPSPSPSSSSSSSSKSE